MFSSCQTWTVRGCDPSCSQNAGRGAEKRGRHRWRAKPLRDSSRGAASPYQRHQHCKLERLVSQVLTGRLQPERDADKQPRRRQGLVDRCTKQLQFCYQLEFLYQYFGQHVWQAVEGTEASLDRPLYQQIFKDITIVPVGTCRDVCDAIAGLNVVPQLNHMESRGLVDGDNRDDSASLREKGVSALDVYVVESVPEPRPIAVVVQSSRRGNGFVERGFQEAMTSCNRADE